MAATGSSGGSATGAWMSASSVSPTLLGPRSPRSHQAVLSPRRRGTVRLLPRRQRAVIALRYYLDQTEGQTADALGCSVGTVKSQTAKALARLRVLLGADLDQAAETAP